MAFEDVHGAGSLARATEMATFEGVRPTASDDDGSAITFSWEGVGYWRFGYIPPDLVWIDIRIEGEMGFIPWAATKAIEVADEVSGGTMRVVAVNPQLGLGNYLRGMGFGDAQQQEDGRILMVGDPERIVEWAEWVTDGKDPSSEPAWRSSLREAGFNIGD